MPEAKLEQIAPYRWRLSQDFQPGMNVPGEIIASESMIPHILSDNTPKQVANVATLPGIVGASLAMPDIHWGYGFPIGGVAAFDLDEGIISPGGVGYDINCGVSLLRSNLTSREIRSDIPKLVDALFNRVPCGVGSEGKIKLSGNDLTRVLEKGARWVVEQGLADKDDLEFIEENGGMTDSDPSLVSDRARERARKQLGTLGSGNHFLEIQVVEKIFQPEIAEAFGLYKGQVVVMIHSGSRGLGHQVCDESLKVMQGAARKYQLDLVDRQLACAPFKSPEGQDYFSVMKCAANYAWANRLAMSGLVRQTFAEYYGKPWQSLGMSMVWDVCHNIASVEEFAIDSSSHKRKLCVHRKGATRAFGPGDSSLPERYRNVGQPVLIPGDMGRASYVLAGTETAYKTTFGSTCHGAGRVMSRKAAVRATQKGNIARKLAERGIIVRSRGKWTLNEEIPEAYKDVEDVVAAVHGAGISQKVARLKPMGTVKG
ncbi:MAG: RtcB family protein [Candidatus Hatepunaea meridiana]|nr:RtcB family protein [Candidatus Hatepunaea meridiana]